MRSSSAPQANFFTLWTFLIEFAIEFMSKTQLKYISETVTGAGLTLRGGPGPPFPSKKWGPRRAGPPFFEPKKRAPPGPGGPVFGPALQHWFPHTFIIEKWIVVYG